MVDGEAELGLVALCQDEAVLGVAAGGRLRGQLGDGARAAGEVLGVVAAELEVEGHNVVARLAHEQIADVDVLGCAAGSDGGGREGWSTLLFWGGGVGGGGGLGGVKCGCEDCSCECDDGFKAGSRRGTCSRRGLS